jgi:hypothetical protein
MINDNKEFIPYLINDHDTFLINQFNQYITVPLHNHIIAEQSNLQDDPDYSKLLTLKAADGMKFYKMPNNSLYSTTYIPVFNGFPSMVKSDTISVKVYKDSIDGYSIVEYTIYKSKIKDYVKLYFRILNL